MKIKQRWKYVLTSTLAAAVLAANAWAANVVANASVNVRSAPDNNASIVCCLPKSAKAEKLGTSGNWIYVKYNDKTGYVYKRFVDDETTGSTPTTPAEKTTTVYTTANLQVREKASTGSKSLGVLKKGTAVQTYSKSNGWYEIRYNGKKAYISAQYTTTTKPTSTTPAEKTTTVYTTENLQVREKASTSSKSLGVLKKGTAVETYNQINGWYEIRYNGKKAYISAQYVTTVKPTSTTPEKTTTVYTTANLQVREKASTGSKSLGVLKKGTAVRTYSKSNGWYEIRYNGKKAYISAQYTTTTKPTSTTPAQKTTTVYTTANLQVREKASTSSKRLGVLKKGTAVQTYSKSNGWYEIRYNGKKAYISAQYTTTTKPTSTTPAQKPTTVYTTANLQVREKASTSSKRLGVLKKGTAVQTYSKSNGWYEIRYNGKKAYISAQYTTATKPKA